MKKLFFVILTWMLCASCVPAIVGLVQLKIEYAAEKKEDVAKNFNVLHEYAESEQLMCSIPEYKISDVERTIREAKDAGADVSAFEALFPELKKKAWMLGLKCSLRELREYAENKQADYDPSHIIRDVELATREAKKAGNDVSHFEVQLPDLKKKAWSVYYIHIEEVLGELREYAEGYRSVYDFPDYIIEKVEKVIEIYRNAGHDVSSVEVQLVELKRRAWIYCAEGMLEQLKRSTEGKYIAEERPKKTDFWKTHFYEYDYKHKPKAIYARVRHAIDEAKNAGSDVSSLEIQFPELQEKFLRLHVKRHMDSLEFYARGCRYYGEYRPPIPSLIEETQSIIAFTKDCGVNVSDFEAIMPDLVKKAWKVEIQRQLENGDYGFSLVIMHKRQAEKDGIDVDGMIAEYRTSCMEKID